MTNKIHKAGVYNEWGKLREVVIGIEDNTVVADYVPALKWETKEARADFKKHGGRKSIDVDTKRISSPAQSSIADLRSVCNGVIFYKNRAKCLPSPLPCG
ncbi:MAG: hypothetical protein L6437_15580 [Kiritimatiellae bacterium]|nr:hypothetical protein [Verrucomicrobiota bacterium]MBU4286100.1 hypothetical protein [Verrucomicrobiota bacterium]MBU4366155.1 hypothetical protein [Verrucomicrobiota bacterium]MCG2661653.1 hypothetical protein [Kiritimatiellia bacterium]